MALTATGEHLLAAVRPLAASVEAFQADFEEVRRSHVSSVRVGMRATGARDLVQISLLDHFEACHPMSRLTVERGFTHSLIDRLQRGKLDFVFASVADPSPSLESKPFSFDRPGLLMRSSSRLAEHEEVPLSALDGSRLAVLPYSLGRELDAVIRSLARAGARLEPHRELHESLVLGPDDPELLIFRARPEATDADMLIHSVWRPLQGAPLVTVHLVRRRLSQHSPSREAFWRFADDVSRSAVAAASRTFA